MAKPNAGLPHSDGSDAVYDVTPKLWPNMRSSLPSRACASWAPAAQQPGAHQSRCTDIKGYGIVVK